MATSVKKNYGTRDMQYFVQSSVKPDKAGNRKNIAKVFDGKTPVGDILDWILSNGGNLDDFYVQVVTG